MKDLEASKRFYRALLSAIGLPDALVEGEGHFYADEPVKRSVTSVLLTRTEL